MSTSDHHGSQERDWTDSWDFSLAPYDFSDRTLRELGDHLTRSQDTRPSERPALPFGGRQLPLPWAADDPPRANSPPFIDRTHNRGAQLNTFGLREPAFDGYRSEIASNFWQAASRSSRTDPSAYMPNDLFDSPSDLPFLSNRSMSSPSSDRPSSPSFLDFVDINENCMPTATHSRAQASSSHADPIVDLTTSSPPLARPQPQHRLGARSHNRMEPPNNGKKRRTRSADGDVGGLDLTQDNGAPNAEEELQQTELQQAVAIQQSRMENRGPTRIGQKTCIICMETYTNATVTACGHMYCHECLMQALTHSAKSNDKTTGSCPACRKPIHISGRRKDQQIVPITFMKQSQFKGKRSNVAT